MLRAVVAGRYGGRKEYVSQDIAGVAQGTLRRKAEQIQNRGKQTGDIRDEHANPNHNPGPKKVKNTNSWRLINHYGRTFMAKNIQV